MELCSFPVLSSRVGCKLVAVSVVFTVTLVLAVGLGCTLTALSGFDSNASMLNWCVMMMFLGLLMR
jgi:hypothetical protein